MRLNCAFSTVSGSKVDSKTGLITGVSVITVGKAEGHDCYVDATTLKQVAEVGQAYPNGVKVKMNHWSGFEAIVGTLRNFRVEDNQVRADFQLLQTTDERDKIIEMAQTIPETFGFSISFDGGREEIEKVEYARCKEIYSVDLVDAPAANPSGLFSKGKNVMINLEHKAACKALGLAETSTPEQVSAALLAKLSAPAVPPVPAVVPPLKADTAALETVNASLEKLTKSLETLEKRDADREKASGKAERQALIAQASREGKVIPFEDAEVLEIPVPLLRSMLSKLKPEVPLSKRPVKEFDPTKRDDVRKALVGAEDRASQKMTEFFDQQFRRGN